MHFEIAFVTAPKLLFQYVPWNSNNTADPTPFCCLVAINFVIAKSE